MLVSIPFCSTLDAMSRWGDEKTLHFIQLYRQRECLWNTRSPFYKNKSAREQAYRSMLEKFNDDRLDLKNVKIKIKNLRSVYHTELKRVQYSARCGHAGQVYKPILSWFDEMHAFLGDSLEPMGDNSEMESLGLSANDKEIPTQEYPVKVEYITIEEKLEPNVDPLQNMQAEINDNESSLDPAPSLSERQPLRTQNRLVNRRKRPHDSVTYVLQRLENTISNAVDTIQHNQAVRSQHEDEFHMFALSVAAQLRQLPLHTAVNTQSKIQSILSEARLKSISSSSLSQPSIVVVKSENVSDE